MPSLTKSTRASLFTFQITPILCILLIGFTVLTNNAYGTTGTAITNKIEGVGPKKSIRPFVCIQNANGVVTPGCDLKYGQTIDAAACSGNPYYAGMSIRFNGCDTTDTYLGFLNVNLQPYTINADGYTPPGGVPITVSDIAINTTGNLTGTVNYTQIPVNNDLPKAKPGIYWDFVGINLSGLEFSAVIDPTVVPNLSTQAAQACQQNSSNCFTDLQDTTSFINEGVNTVRVPVRWAYLQFAPGSGDIYMDYYTNYVQPTLRSLTKAQIYTIIDLHAYMHYEPFGLGYAGCGNDPNSGCPNGTRIVDPEKYKDLWGKLYTLIKNDTDINQDYIMLDLVNEPVLKVCTEGGSCVDNSGTTVFDVQTQVIQLLRGMGFNGYILVEGNTWTGLHSWTTYTWTDSVGKSYSNATLFTRDNFISAGITDLSKIIINVHQYFDADFSGTSNTCQTDLTTTGPDGFNLNAFAEYLHTNQLKAMVTEFGTGTDSATCTPALTSFFDYLKQNSAKGEDHGFAGWTIWSTGHGWGNYNLRITPSSYQNTVMKNYLQ